MKLDAHYVDPRLVELYDLENPPGVDTDFFLSLAAEVKAGRIIDLGCGTGTLACELAKMGCEVIGVDPSAAMLAVAQRKAAAGRVRWIEGDARVLEKHEADLAIMTGNVAQVFLDDAEWITTLGRLHRALRPGGYLAFESRNPLARGWERWQRENTFARMDTPFGKMTCWLELVHVGDGTVQFVGHNVFESTGEDVVASSELRFRSLAEFTGSFEDSGFVLEQLYGDWQHAPFSETSQLMIFVLRGN